ncbi:MAG: hypothetical protein SFV15_08600 [Polyangiaceae bacterium]|nr:hypothetical protein [Polyangiaceae bacterium]
MRTVEFFKVSRAVQDRFTHSAKGLSQPVPLIFSASTEARWRAPFLGSVVAVLAAFGAGAVGFGNPENSLAIAPLPAVAVYSALLLTAAVGFLMARVRFMAPKLLPYRPGRYLFPFGVVDARTDSFKVSPLNELEAIEAKGSVLRLKFKEGLSDFDAGASARAEQLVEAVRSSQASYAAALEAMNLRDLAALDPLRDTGFSNPFSPKTPLLPPSQKRFVALGLLVALPVSVGLGYVGFMLRNKLSEARLFEHAVQVNTPASYRTYLLRGGARPVVVETLLPRAELLATVQGKNTEALLGFAKSHAGSKIEAEISAALKQALLGELKRAAAEGTLTALVAFHERYQREQTLFRGEYEEALNRFYASILARYQQSAVFSANNLEFVRKLLNFSRTFRGTVLVRFRRVLRASLTTADRQVEKSIYYAGAESLPSQYFDAKRSEPREARAGQALAQKWQQIFPEDVLKFALGPPVDEPEGTPVVFPVPTLLVEYVVGGAGIYLSRKPRGVFVGVGLVFNAVFTIPDVAESLVFKSSSWKVPDAAGLELSEGTFSGVYESVAQEGFDRFLRLYEAEYFPVAAHSRVP